MLKLLLVVFVLFLTGCFSFYCENTIKNEIPSPNGKFKAIVFDRGCGATTGFVTGISIVDAGKTIDDSETGNVLTAKAPYLDDTPSNFLVEWISEDELRVSHPIDSGASRTDRVHGVRIAFRDLER